MEAARMVEHERVHIWDITNGSRITTRAIKSTTSIGASCINGAVAILLRLGVFPNMWSAPECRPLFLTPLPFRGGTGGEVGTASSRDPLPLLNAPVPADVGVLTKSLS